MKEDASSVVKLGVERTAKDLTKRLERLGFRRTKKSLWVRLKSSSADFVHLHRRGSSYGRPINYSVEFRIHCGNRELCDPFEALALNGPDSDSQEARAHRYHLRFNAKSDSTYERCIEDLEKFVIEIGEPWFSTLKHDTPPIGCPEETVLASHKMLGIKEQKS